MTREQLALIEKAEELEAADVLKERELFDDSVSRAYYAMFLCATALLLSIPGKSFKRHSAVHAAFGLHWAKAGKIDSEYHRWLTNAFDARGKADYHTNQNSTAADAELHTIHATAFLNRVREILEQNQSTES